MNVSFKNTEVIVFDLDGTIVNLTADWMSLRDILVEMYREQYREDCNFERVQPALMKLSKKKMRKPYKTLLVSFGSMSLKT